MAADALIKSKFKIDIFYVACWRFCKAYRLGLKIET